MFSTQTHTPAVEITGLFAMLCNNAEIMNSYFIKCAHLAPF